MLTTLCISCNIGYNMETNEDLPPQNFKSPEDVSEFESLMDKASKGKKLHKKDAEKLKKVMDKLAGDLRKLETLKSVVETPMAELYKKAWSVVYKKQQTWRQKEIDTTLKSGRLSDREWDDDFVRAVIYLAESDDFVQKSASTSE
jgi:hypothetical protein